MICPYCFRRFGLLDIKTGIERGFKSNKILWCKSPDCIKKEIKKTTTKRGGEKKNK